MKLRQLPNEDDFSALGTAELRDRFLVDSLFAQGQLQLNHFEYERAIIGSAVPGSKPLTLDAPDLLKAEYFAERREVGVINLGGPGEISVDGTAYPMEKRDTLYIGRGSRQVEFRSNDANQSAHYYLVSYPAHQNYPTTHLAASNIEPMQIGSLQESNVRSIYQAIIPGNIESCQLVMGFTELAEGSVWNTMPAHRHVRRMEVYLYYDLPKDGIVVHLMGPPDETRHIITREKEAVFSPSWSMHTGAGTGNYGFVWAMGGENQDYTDMDGIPMPDLK